MKLSVNIQKSQGHLFIPRKLNLHLGPLLVMLFTPIGVCVAAGYHLVVACKIPRISGMLRYCGLPR